MPDIRTSWRNCRYGSRIGTSRYPRGPKVRGPESDTPGTVSPRDVHNDVDPDRGETVNGPYLSDLAPDRVGGSPRRGIRAGCQARVKAQVFPLTCRGRSSVPGTC